VPEISKFPVKVRRILKGHLSKVYSLSWASDSRHLVSASQDGKLIVWDAVAENKVAAIPLKSAWVMTCAYSPSGKLVACGGLDNTVSVFNLRSKTQPIRPIRELVAHTGYVTDIAFVNDRQLVSASGDCTCILWDVETRKMIQTFSEHICDVMTISVAPDRSTFVSGACDASARIWDMRTGRTVQTFPGHHSDINAVQFFPTGLAFGTGSDDGTCRLFDIRADRQLVQYTDDRILCSVTSISFSRSGRLLFGGYDDFNCAAWDVLKGSYVATLDGHGNRVSALQVSPSGSALATGSWDSILKIWSS
jgi:guanine nucleotide-binding protein G(I)/G(S)/G(T) subunit beta-1